MNITSRAKATPWLASISLVIVVLVTWFTLEAPGVPQRLHRFRPSAQSVDTSLEHIPHPSDKQNRFTFADPSKTAFQSLLRRLYRPSQDIDAAVFRDYAGNEWETPGEPLWTKPLGKKLCIVDIDTRPLDGKDEILDENPLNWDTTHPLAAGMLNHYMYGKSPLFHHYQGSI